MWFMYLEPYPQIFLFFLLSFYMHVLYLPVTDIPLERSVMASKPMQLIYLTPGPRNAGDFTKQSHFTLKK